MLNDQLNNRVKQPKKALLEPFFVSKSGPTIRFYHNLEKFKRLF